MYIHKAVKRALKIDGVIYRKSEREPIGKYERSCFTMIKPSNGYECCRALVFRMGNWIIRGDIGIQRLTIWQQMTGIARNY